MTIAEYPNSAGACATKLLSLLLLLALPAATQAQFNYTTNNGTVTITKYTGAGGAVAIPDRTNGWPVVGIGPSAFDSCSSITTLTIPNSVTSIGDVALANCTGLTNLAIPSSVTNIGLQAFLGCTGLAEITVEPLNSFYCSVDGVLFNTGRTTLIQYPPHRRGYYAVPGSVTRIGDDAFACSTNLTGIIIPRGVTSLGDMSFFCCYSLTTLCFQGNAPSLDGTIVFFNDTLATVYYMPGTTNWSPKLGSLPTMLWNPQIASSGPAFGIQANQFGFTITGTSNLLLVVEACADLAHPVWSAVAMKTLTNGSCYFSDPQWTNYPGQFYRLSAP